MSDSSNTLELFQAAVADDLRSLAFIHGTELRAETLADIRKTGFPENLGLKLESPSGREALAALGAAMTSLPAAPTQEEIDLLAADFAAIYLTHGERASPCESFWLDDEHIVYQEPMFQVRQWYVRQGLAARNWRRMSDDHLVLELEFVAHLMEKGAPAEAARFLDEHLLRWIGLFAEKLVARDVSFYSPLAFFTWAYCEELRELLAQLLGEPRPGKEEIEARFAKPEARPQEMPLQYMPGVTPSW